MLRILIITLLFLFNSTIEAVEKYKFTTKSDIYVVGDVHGAYHEIRTTLRNMGLIDEQNNWSGGKSHFVSLGDLLDRGPSSRQVLDLYMKLQLQAESAGGKFHVVLGNHEVMNLTGDLRYLSSEEIAEFALDENHQQRQEEFTQYLSQVNKMNQTSTIVEFDKLYPKGYFAHKAAFSVTGKYGKWLLSLPFVMQINDQVFIHGGLSSSVRNRSLDDFNIELKKSLFDYLNSWQKIENTYQPELSLSYRQRVNFVASLDESTEKTLFLSAQSQLLFASDGPTWYRGNALCHPYFESDSLAAVLKNWKAKRLWAGHTTTPNRNVLHRLNGQLILLDTGMLNSHYQGTPYVGLIQKKGETKFINGLTNETVTPELAVYREEVNPYGMTDEQVEDFMLTAKVTDKKDIEEGKTKPYKITLEKDGKKIHAIFKYKDSDRNLNRGNWSSSKETADRYQFGIAAYKLDRMLGIGLVPVTVERELDGQSGLLQLWVDNLISDLTVNENKIPYSGFCNPHDQVNLMNSFDYLIMNRDRNQTNIMYSQNDWQIWFIDHSRSFGTSRKKPDILKRTKIIPTKTFNRALEKLTMEDLESLSPWLHNKQIKAIWYRRNKLLRGPV